MAKRIVQVKINGKVVRRRDVIIAPTTETLWTIVDICKKKKSDIRFFDEGWNEAPPGTIFVYASNVTGVSHFSCRDRLENWASCRLVKRLKKIKCPSCCHIEDTLVEVR